jgi:translation initiation factor eIF-2B subunit delta
MPAQLFFSHLPEHRDPGTPAALASDKIHPVVVRLGVLIASGTLRGASARTIGVLQAFREVVRDYTCPDTAVFWKDLATHISPMIAYLETCRPKGVGVGNAIRWFKGEITHLGEAHDGRAAARAEDMQKAKLMAAIDGYIQDRIVVAGQVIAEQIQEKIKPGSTVAVYARSSVVERALLDAFAHMQAQVPAQSFTVAVIDSRPLEEGRALLGALTAAGIPCTYTLLPLASTMIARASLVLFGASSLNSDGALHSRAGTAVVAMLAKEHRVPVVACVETFKLSERVGLDDLASNELGPEDDVLNIPNARALEITRPIPKHLTPLNLLYDLTPPSHITAVCTEVGFIPPSSVPTLLGKDVMVAA